MGASHSMRNPYEVVLRGHGGNDNDRTTLLQTLQEGEMDIDMYGFKRVKISLGEVHVECWDFGDIDHREQIVGRCPARYMFKCAFRRADGIVHVIDSTEFERLDKAMEEIGRDLLGHWFDDFGDRIAADKVIMILATKQDAEGALPLEKIQLKVKEIVTNSKTVGRRCFFVAGCSEQQDGLKEAMTLFSDQILRRREGWMKTGFINLATIREEKNKSKMHIILKRLVNTLAH